MKKPQTEQRFEFALLINDDKIICQRLFDVKGYNEKVRHSDEMKELLDTIVGININEIGAMGIIPDFLKRKSIDSLWDYYDPYKEQKNEDVVFKSVNERNDTFKFEIKVDGEVIGSSSFSGNFIQPKIRYSVDIRELIPEIIQTIKFYLSKNSYSTQFSGFIKNKNTKLSVKK